MSRASTVTWGTVAPRVLAAIEERKVALVIAEPGDVMRLQAEAKAMIQIAEWFEAGARSNDPMSTDENPY